MKRTGFMATAAVGVVILVLAAFWLGRGVGAQAFPEPGSPGDPLVTVSWVTQFIDKRTELVVVDVPAGGRLIADAGTELILRAGQATAIDSPLGGLANVTAGHDLKRGEHIPANHLLIIPRGDGRGLLAVTDVIVLVRGGYRLEN